MKNEGGRGTGKVVIWKVLRHRVLRHDRAALKIKAKARDWAAFPTQAPSAGSRLREDASADPITGDQAAT